MSIITRSNTNLPRQRLAQHPAKETGTLAGRIVSQLKATCNSKTAKIAARIAVVALAAIAVTALVLGVLVLTHGAAAAPLIKFIASVIGSTAAKGLTTGVIGAGSLIAGGAGVLAATLAYRVSKLIKLNRMHNELSLTPSLLDRFRVFFGLGLSEQSKTAFINYLGVGKPTQKLRPPPLLNVATNTNAVNPQV